MRCTVTARWSAINVEVISVRNVVSIADFFILNANANRFEIILFWSSKMKKTSKIITLILILAVVASCIFVFTACDSDNRDNQLVVGLECAYIPFNFTQTTDANGAVKISNADGYANGYDVMIAKRIADALGKELVISKMEWDALVPAVQASTIDLVIAGMSPTAERRESIDFSDAYYDSNLVIVVRKDGAYANATSLSDFKGAKLVAQQGTFHDKALETQESEIGYTRLTPREDFPTMTSELSAKMYDGYVAEEPGASADCSANKDLTYIHLLNNENGFTATKDDTQIAIGMRYGYEHKDAINNLLATLSEEERIEIMQNAAAYSVDNTSGESNFFTRIGNIIFTYYASILKGVGYTILVAIVGTIVGLIIGLLIGMYRTMEEPKNNALKVLKKIGDVILSIYIEIFRGTPMMVQAMVIFWGFALISGGTTMNVTLAGLIIVSINTGAYMAEIVRGGIISIDKGQFEGAQAIGMTHSQTMFHIVLPQALRNIMPSVANEFVINIKDTSVLNIIGFTELFFYAKDIALNTYAIFESYLVAAVIYFILTFTITRILRFVEKKMDGKKNYKIMGSQNMDTASILREQDTMGGGNND